MLGLNYLAWLGIVVWIVSGLGYQLGTAISIQTEATLNNHGIVGLAVTANENWELAA